DAATAARWCNHYRTLLAAVLEQPGEPLGVLPVLSAAELRLMLDGWNATAAHTDEDDATVPELIARRAKRTPAAAAVSCGGTTLSYAELEERAGRLARHLAGFGVGPGVPVGLGFEPSLDQMVAALAIWKAGGAYVP